MNVRNDFSSIGPLPGDTQTAAVEKSSAASPAVSSAIPAVDQAHLSSASALVSHAASLPDVRTEKVQSVQAAIANGTYQVSATDVAQSLISSMLGKQG
jgi:negative regulator of flagellin synthesis FlgM